MVTIEQYQHNRWYLRYKKQKAKLRLKYPSNLTSPYGRDFDREIWQKYLIELSKIIWKPDGNFQKFIREVNISNPHNKITM
jgi:hypothetical protein